MTTELSWPRCGNCGHIAQEHNRKLGQEPDNYGCDACPCPGYAVPASFPKEQRIALETQRAAILSRLDKREADRLHPLRIKKLGIEWGAAFAEAGPVKIEVKGNDTAEAIEVFVKENHELVIEFRGGFQTDFIKGKMRITLGGN